jgi:hypothetical protein
MHTIHITTVERGLYKRNPRALLGLVQRALDHNELALVTRYIERAITGVKQAPLRYTLIVAENNPTFVLVKLYADSFIKAWETGDWCTSTLLAYYHAMPRRWPNDMPDEQRKKLRDYTRRSKDYFDAEYQRFMMTGHNDNTDSPDRPRRPPCLPRAELLRRDAATPDRVPARAVLASWDD